MGNNLRIAVVVIIQNGNEMELRATFLFFLLGKIERELNLQQP